MDNPDKFSFFRYPWQKYALAMGAALISMLFVHDIRLYQFNYEIKESHQNWAGYQNKMFFLFVFYGVVLLILIGQLLIAKLARTKKRAWISLFLLLVFSTLAMGIASYLFIASSAEKTLQFFCYLFLSLLVAGLFATGIKIYRLSSGK
ncbi:MAG: hypothetical protein SPK23_02095 [Eubacteriales bacterium]|nr:hypothetical protein [Clostridiales bacterium]MDY5835905.1 hypothetical protein [Eubacteriales bacterium]